MPFGQNGELKMQSSYPHPGDKRFQRRKEERTFGDSDDASRSIGRDVQQHSGTKNPRNEGDKGD